jgi:hypothetical protein
MSSSNTLSSKKARLVVFALTAGLVPPVAFMAACSSSNNSNPVPPAPTYDVDATANLPDGSNPQGDDASAGDDAAAADAADARVIIPEDAQACTLARLPAQGAPASDAGCWNAADPNCKAQTDPQFLNQCAGTGVTCARFDNSRLPGYDGGALPSFN